MEDYQKRHPCSGQSQGTQYVRLAAAPSCFFSRHYFSRAFLPQKETALVPEVPAGGRKGNAIKFQIGQDDEDDDDQERSPSRLLVTHHTFFLLDEIHCLRHVIRIFSMSKF
jgi:hypothetical protein